ncbi:MAG: methyltransferase domain-containing protein, partial [Oscillospiraceae bacterium]
MTFTWNENTIRWYKNAGLYTGFYTALTRRLVPMLPPEESFCDMGCGLGLVDLNLAQHLHSITCVDINASAIADLEAEIEKRGITTIHTVLGDCFEVPGPWHTIYLSFYATRQLERFANRCQRLVVVVSGESETQLFPNTRRTQHRDTIADEVAYLESQHLPYQLSVEPMEFGQPFQSLHDARCFVETYDPGITAQERDAFLASRLVQTSIPCLPLFMPREKPVGIFDIDV